MPGIILNSKLARSIVLSVDSEMLKRKAKMYQELEVEDFCEELILRLKAAGNLEGSFGQLLSN